MCSAIQEGESEGAHKGRGIGKSQRQKRDNETEDPDIYGSEQDVDGTSTTRSSVAGENESETISEALIPIMGEEVAEYFTLDEQLAMFQQLLNGQDKRQGMVRLASAKTPVAFRTLDVPPAWVSPEDVDAYLVERFRSLRYALPLAEAIEKAEKREQEFVQSIMQLATDSEPKSARRKVTATVKPIAMKKSDSELEKR